MLVGVVNKTTNVLSMMATDASCPAIRVREADNGSVVGCVVFARAGERAGAARYTRTFTDRTLLIYSSKHNNGKMFK